MELSEWLKNRMDHPKTGRKDRRLHVSITTWYPSHESIRTPKARTDRQRHQRALPTVWTASFNWTSFTIMFRGYMICCRNAFSEHCLSFPAISRGVDPLKSLHGIVYSLAINRGVVWGNKEWSLDLEPGEHHAPFKTKLLTSPLKPSLSHLELECLYVLGTTSTKRDEWYLRFATATHCSWVPCFVRG